MKSITKHITAILLSVAVVIASMQLVQAGSLTPPGAPAPTMKTLLELDSRIVINQLNTPGDSNSIFNISNPGNYVLVNSFNVPAGMIGIKIQARGVDVHLGGNTITGDPASDDLLKALLGPPIALPPPGIGVTGGRLEGGGADGIDLEEAERALIEHMEAIRQAADALKTGPNAWVSDVEARGAGGSGVVTGDDSEIMGVKSNGNGDDGIRTGNRSTVKDSESKDNGGDGLEALEQLLAEAVRVLNNGEDGVEAGDEAHLRSIEALDNTLFGGNLRPLPTDGESDVGDSRFDDNGAGGLLLGDDSKVTGSSANGNTGNGLTAAEKALMRALEAHSNTGNGATVGDGAIILDSKFDKNGGDGLQGGDDLRASGSSGCGNGGNGISADARAFLEAVREVQNTLAGVVAGSESELLGCDSDDNGEHAYLLGDGCQLQNSSGSGNGFTNTPAVQAGNGCMIRNTTLINHNKGAIFMGQDGEVSGCKILGVPGAGPGIDSAGGSVIRDNVVHNINGPAIISKGAGDMVRGNTCRNSSVGIQMINNSTYLQNICGGNTVDYGIAAGAAFGPIVNIAGAGDIQFVAGSQHPQANFQD